MSIDFYYLIKVEIYKGIIIEKCANLCCTWNIVRNDDVLKWLRTLDTRSPSIFTHSGRVLVKQPTF